MAAQQHLLGNNRTSGSSYWQSATDSHKANESYYSLVESTLDRLVVPLLSSDDDLFDFGCGNGEYTRRLARHTRTAVGMDISAPLIAAAIDAADDPSAAVSDRVRFEVGTTPPSNTKFDVVVCMGVLVCLLRDTDFVALLSALGDGVGPGGTLVLRETFSLGDAQVIELSDYVAHYRTPLDYLRPLAEAGLVLEHDEHLVTWSDTDQRSNHLWILRRPT